MLIAYLSVAYNAIYLYYPVHLLPTDHFVSCKPKIYNLTYRAAILTVSNEHYAPYVLRLGASITRHVGVNKVDMLLYLMSPNTSNQSNDEVFYTSGWQQIHRFSESTASSLLFSKFVAWNLTQYDIVLLLDADVLIVDDISELFTLWGPILLDPTNRVTLAAALDQPQQRSLRWTSSAGQRFNAGVVLLRPDRDVYLWLVDAIERIPYDNLFEQTILNAGLRAQHIWLDQEFNSMAVVAYAVPWSWPARPRIIHFTHPKPADNSPDCDVQSVAPLCAAWRSAPVIACDV